MLDKLFDSVVHNVTEYCSREDTRRRLEAQVLAPLLSYLGERFAWGVRLFQVVAVLVLIQTLVLLWLLGLVSSYTMGGLIHVLLVIAIIVVLVRVIQGRRIS